MYILISEQTNVKFIYRTVATRLCYIVLCDLCSAVSSASFRTSQRTEVCCIVCAMISCFFGLGTYLPQNNGVIFSLTPGILRVWR